MGGSDSRTFDISPDGTLLATQDAGIWQLEIFDLRTGKSSGRFGKIDDSTVIAFSPGGRTAVTACWDRGTDRPVDVWDLEQRRHIRSLDEGVSLTPFSALAFSSDGRLLALGTRSEIGGQPKIHVWDARSGEELFRMPPAAVAQAEPRGDRRFLPRRLPGETTSYPFGPLAFSPDARSLALVVDDRVVVVEVVSGRERALIDLLPPVRQSRAASIDTAARAIAWLSNRTIAVGCRDGLIRRYDLLEGRRLIPLSGHKGSVVVMRVLADRRTMLSLGTDNVLCEWDVDHAARFVPPPASELSEPAWQENWKALAGPDLQGQHRAHLTIAAATNGVELLATKVAPVPPVDAARIARLVRTIASENYNERRQAAVELRALGELAVPALREATRESEYARVFLSQIQGQSPADDETRQHQTIQVLLESQSDAARRLLDELAQGAAGAELTRRASVARECLVRKTYTPPAAALEDLWLELADEDAGRAWLAVRALAIRSDSVAFLRERLPPVQKQLADEDDPRYISRLIAELDADGFAVREAASQVLRQMGARLHPQLRQALAKTESSEAKMRLERLLQHIGESRPSAVRLQVERSAEVLALIESSELK